MEDGSIWHSRNYVKLRSYCSVNECPSKYNKHLNLSFHLFPKPDSRLVFVKNTFGNIEKIDKFQAWKRALRVKEPCKSTRVCSLHFKKSDYILPDQLSKKNKHLKNIAVPSCNLPNNCEAEKLPNKKAQLEGRMKRIETKEGLDTNIKNEPENQMNEMDQFIKIENDLDVFIKNEYPIEENYEIIKNEINDTTSESYLKHKSILYDLLNKHKNVPDNYGDTGNGIVKTEPTSFTPNLNEVLIKCEYNSDNEDVKPEFPIDIVKEEIDIVENKPTVSNSNELEDKSVFNVFVDECVPDEPTQPIFHCKFCPETFSLEKDLKNHQVIHDGIFQHICKDCNASFSSSIFLNNHLKSKFHKNMTTSNKITSKPKHVNSTNNNRELYCRICSKYFTKTHIYEKHLRAHKNGRDLICKLCNKSFVRPANLTRHMKLHTKAKQQEEEQSDEIEIVKIEGPFNCPKCLKTFTNWHLFKEHLPEHADGKNEICLICYKCFRLTSELERHKQIHKNTEPLTCNVCDKKFARKDYVKKHMLMHTGQAICLCCTCGKACRSESELKLHEVLHKDERPYKCNNCGKAFNALNNLRVHERTHTVERPFTCEECGGAFKIQSDLKKHQRLHFEKGTHVCTICEKAFSTMYHLKVHERIHTGEKPCMCKECGKSFSDPSGLRIHMYSHTGEKPYFCHICTKRFSQGSHLNRHIRKQHSK